MADRTKGDGGGAAPRPKESAPRAIAARVLARVWAADAFASAALDAELRRAPALDPRDVGLATELVYGVLRAQGALEARIAEFAAKSRWTTDPLVRAHVLMGAYSLCFLDRVPSFAAVSEAVDGAQAAGGPRVGAFANAVLRRLAAAMEAGRPPLAGAVVASAPGWLRGALRRSLGRAAAEAFLSAGPVPPPTGLCLAPGEDRDAWLEALRGAAPAASFEPGRVSPAAIVARGTGDLRRLPGFGAAWIGQEEGAQALALALGARPGERVLDACAGRGNKSWILSRAVLPGGAVDAADLYPAKLSQLRATLSAPPASSEGAGEEGAGAQVGEAQVGDAPAREAQPGGAQAGAPGGLERAAAFVRETYAVDWTVGAGDVPEGYDRVLVDAPCSGVGTLRRRPEIALRRDADDLPRLADLQVAIARRAATRARDGGRLVFAVCSVLREECEAVAARLADPAEDDLGVRLEPAPFDAEIARELAGGGDAFRLLPHVHGTDGYFAAMFIVRR